MAAVQVEKALKPIWQGISYLVRGKEFGTEKDFCESLLKYVSIELRLVCRFW